MKLIEFLRDHTKDHEQARWFIVCLHDLLDQAVGMNEMLPGATGTIRSATKLNEKFFMTVTRFEVVSRDRDFVYDTDFEIEQLTEEEFATASAEIRSNPNSFLRELD